MSCTTIPDPLRDLLATVATHPGGPADRFEPPRCQRQRGRRQGGIITKYASYNEPEQVSYGLDLQDDELRFVYRGDEFSTTGLNLVPGEWVHVAGTWDGNDVRLYADGVQVAFGDDLFTSMADNEVPINIGAFEAFASGNRAAHFDGLVDEVYIFDRVLTPAEIVVISGL